MTETTDKTLTVTPKKTLGLKRGNIERDTVRQSFSHGRTNTVQVERKKRRVVMPGEAKAETAAPRAAPEPETAAAPAPVAEKAAAPAAPAAGVVLRHLSDDEIDARAKALAMTAEPLPAQTAADWGLIWRTYPDDQLMEEARALTARPGAATIHRT